MLTEQQVNSLKSVIQENVAEATKNLDSIAEKVAKQHLDGAVLKETFDEYKEKAEASATKITQRIDELGLTIQQAQLIHSGKLKEEKSLQEVMFENKDAILASTKSNAVHTEFMVYADKDGNLKAVRYDTRAEGGPSVYKAVGPHSTVDAAGGAGTVSSVAQSLSGASILRLGKDSEVNGLYRNSTFLFNHLNLISAGYEKDQATWWDEVATDPIGSAAAIVPEGTTKPISQYKNVLKSSDYQTAAHILKFTNQYKMDFERLASEALNNGRIDLLNKINTAILPNLQAAATSYTAAMATSFKNGEVVPNANDYDAIVALATQAKNNSFGAAANIALMSTFKEGRMAILKDNEGRYLNPPSYLNNVTLSGNPMFGNDDLIVGDLKQYNIILRGGMIVRVGLDGTDFSENKFSVVQEQMYFDYISEARKVAILKGSTFTSVKNLIGN